VSETVRVSVVSYTVEDVSATDFAMVSVAKTSMGKTLAMSKSIMMRDLVMKAMDAVKTLMVSITVSTFTNDAVDIVKDVRETVMVGLTDESVTVLRDDDTIVKWSNVAEAKVMQT